MPNDQQHYMDEDHHLICTHTGQRIHDEHNQPIRLLPPTPSHKEDNANHFDVV